MFSVYEVEYRFHRLIYGKAPGYIFTGQGTAFFYDVIDTAATKTHFP